MDPIAPKESPNGSRHTAARTGNPETGPDRAEPDRNAHGMQRKMSSEESADNKASRALTD